MNAARFIQIHTLTSYPAVLLNRDDAGLAKRLPYGGASRLRVSSQSLKRHWREAVDEKWALSTIQAPMAKRSRRIIEHYIVPALTGTAPDLIEAIRVSMVRFLYGKDAAKLNGKLAEEERARQALLIGEPEIEFLKRIAIDAAATGTIKDAEALLGLRVGKGEGKANLNALSDGAKLAAGLESALFGRMVTSDTEANIDAAIHVAHAFTVHAEETESDYFTVVDDLRGAETGESGTAGIFDTELTSGLFYGYVVVDVPSLVKNLDNDQALAGRVVEHLLHLIATVSPGAKRGSTAPYAYADLMLVELGSGQPRSLAAAFRKPVTLTGDSLDETLTLLGERLHGLDAAYGSGEIRAALCTRPCELPGVAGFTGLDALATWAAAAVSAEDKAA
jgi:CRISPR system Cascade subunit CasC